MPSHGSRLRMTLLDIVGFILSDRSMGNDFGGD